MKVTEGSSNDETRPLATSLTVDHNFIDLNSVFIAAPGFSPTTHYEFVNTPDLQTQRDKLATEVEDLTAQLENSDELTGCVFHSLRNVPNQVLGFMGLIMDAGEEDVFEAVRKYGPEILSAGERSIVLIDELIQMNQFREVRATFVDLEQVLTEACDNIKVTSLDPEPEIILSGPSTIYGDRKKLVYLIENLISNAWKYRSEDPPQIKILCTEEPDSWKISVSDNGIGIEADSLQEVFVTGKRLDNARHREGFGIGLGACAKIVKLHGGEIWAESEGLGSTFHFTLPKTAQA